MRHRRVEQDEPVHSSRCLQRVQDRQHPTQRMAEQNHRLVRKALGELRDLTHQGTYGLRASRTRVAGGRATVAVQVDGHHSVGASESWADGTEVQSRTAETMDTQEHLRSRGTSEIQIVNLLPIEVDMPRLGLRRPIRK